MSDPYQRANPGDPILADSWNKMQSDVRDHVVSHTHTGANEGALLTGASIDKRSAIEVQKVTATSSLKVKDIDVESKLGALDAGKLAVTGGSISGALTVTGSTKVNAELAVLGKGSIGGELTVGGQLSVRGAASLDSDLTVYGEAKLDRVWTKTITFGDASVMGTAAVIPRGIIVMWTGSAEAPPSGWAICNGQNGTPDLRDRFVVGAGASHKVNASGEADGHQHEVRVNPMPMKTDLGGEHDHNLPNGWYVRKINGYVAAPKDEWTMLDTGGDGASKVSKVQKEGIHFHNLSFPGAVVSTSSSGGPNRPKWYAVCYIMKL